MVNVSLRKDEQLKNGVRLSDTKSGKIKALIITGIGVFISGRLSDPSLYDAIKNYKDKQISINPNKNNTTIDLRNQKRVNLESKFDNNTLSSWLNHEHTEEELREIFINMDLAMKYIHNKGYCIKSFSPKEIELINDSIDQIKYNTLLEMPNNMYDQKELVKEDIYSSAFLQIGAYLNNDSIKYTNQSIDQFLETLKPSFLKDNFDGFSTFLPESDVPYYRGIVQRGASVYLSDYAKEKSNRDLVSLQKEFGEDPDAMQNNSNSVGNNSKFNGKAYTKSNGHSIGVYDNGQINRNIYSQLNNKDAAYIVSIMIPLMMVIGGAALMVLAYLMGS